MEVFEMLVKCIANIQPFDGNEKQLFNFINRIDALVPLIETLNIHFKRIIIGYIQDRLTHEARDTILKHGQVETWTELKSVLKRAHGESTPINSLLDKIALCRCYGTIEQFYNQLSDLLIRLNNAYSLTEQLTNDQITCDKRIVLNCFTANLPDPVKGIIIVRNPPTMDDAYNIILTNGYSEYTNPHKQHPTSHSNYQQKQRNNDFRPRYNYHQNNNTQRRTEFQDPNRQQYNPNYNSSSNFTSAIMRTDKTIIHRATTRGNNNGNHNSIEPMDYSVQSRQTNRLSSDRNNSSNQRGNYRNVFTPSRQTRQSQQSYQTNNATPSKDRSKFSPEQLKQLPYITIDTKIKRLKFIIDTGAEFNIINKNLCQPKWKTFIKSQTLKVFDKHINCNVKCKFPLFDVFNLQNYFVEFLEYPFHTYFDGIIGNNILVPLCSIINYKEQLLITSKAQIPFFLPMNSLTYLSMKLESLKYRNLISLLT